VALENLALEFKNAGKFSNFEWELLSTKYSSNREARKTKGTTFSGEHFHISINAKAIGQY